MNTNSRSPFRSNLSRVKGLGSSKNGFSHWWAQRFSAIALIPLVLWFVLTILKVSHADSIQLMKILRSPGNMIGLMLLLLAAVYHGSLGMQVIFEDYVPEPWRFILVTLVKLIAIVTILAGIAAVLAFHFAFIN